MIAVRDESTSAFMSGFFEEVQRRKVYRVAAAYIIAAGFIIQITSAVFPAWELPNWALRLVILDLLSHRFENARELYADHWLGFSEVKFVSARGKKLFSGDRAQCRFSRKAKSAFSNGIRDWSKVTRSIAGGRDVVSANVRILPLSYC